MSSGSGIATIASSPGSSNLTTYRARIVNSLDDATLKYSNAILDEALRKVLNEYTRAFPNIKTASTTVTAAGRSQPLADCANLITIINLYHPFISTLADPYIHPREDFTLSWSDGSPVVYFKGDHIPQVGEIIFTSYAARQTINLLDSAATTTVRDDHEDLLITGAAGQAAMMRASGLTEKWGSIPGQQSNLMIWGKSQYQRFIDFLIEIRSEMPMDIFPESSWHLDIWDGA
jgi:hypothetical protein